MKSKAQIQSMETIAILLVFFIIVIIVFMFYIRVSGITQEGKITTSEELASIRVSQAASFLPELQCSSKNIVKDNCFDKYKLEAFSTLPGRDLYYYPFFYYSNITVKQIYPNNNNQWEIYSRPANGTSYVTSIPILLYNATSRTNAFGILTVKYYPIR